MEYVELNIVAKSEEQAEIFMAQLSDFAFEAFNCEGDRLQAYALVEEYEACAAEVEALLAECQAEYTISRVEQQNWNAEWEESFEPVDVASSPAVRIRAQHHTPPAEGVVDVVIAPRMSFGTGHHTTTALMTESIVAQSFSGGRGLDMGCGTGVLAIVALKCGAEQMTAVDIDDWACDSCRDSIALSGVAERVDVRCGSIGVVSGEKYDFVLANINRNILLDMMPSFAEALDEGGVLLMSGFFPEDADIVAAAADECGFSLQARRERDGWAVVECIKR
ncbi:MAG: 50S ribosomal protein L11 methyltransferase [Alistipes sp.]|nr:50S ribosomal protein L11 methyltransferase [Alistipes sp.]